MTSTPFIAHESLRVAILQTPAPDFIEQDAAWHEWLDRIDDVARDEPDLIVLPEASYPAWFLGAAANTPPSITDDDLVRALGERARRFGVHIAAGLVLGRPHAPENAAVIVSPGGSEIARASEASPASWFRRGRGPAAFHIGQTPVALVAGDDLYDPQWSEAIANGGVSLVIATGAARGSWRDSEARNDAASFMLPARAVEMGAWIVHAGRVGVEAEAVSYIGGAGVVGPDGRWAVRAPADRPGVVMHTLDLTPARIDDARVPEDHAATPVSGRRMSLHAAALALDPHPSAVDLMESVRASVRAAAALGARLIALPDLSGADPRAVTLAETLPLIEAVSAETRTVVVATVAERANGMLYRTISVVEEGRTLDSHRQTILSESDRRAGFAAGAEVPPVVATGAAGLLGLLGGREACAPGAAASLRRRGAQVIAWSSGEAGHAIEPIARARAWEQRLPLIASSATAGGAFIVEPGGYLQAASREGQPMLVQGEVDLVRIGMV